MQKTVVEVQLRCDVGMNNGFSLLSSEIFPHLSNLVQLKPRTFADMVDLGFHLDSLIKNHTQIFYIWANWDSFVTNLNNSALNIFQILMGTNDC